MNEVLSVPGNLLGVQLWTLVRQLVPIVSSFAVGRGIIAEDTVTAIGGVAGVVVPVVLGQILTRKKAKALKILAESVPNAVAVVR